MILYRRYRDWQHDDGWRMSESLARHEAMEELHRVRQDLQRRMQGAQDPSKHPRRQVDVESEKELRALEYAQQRKMALDVKAQRKAQLDSVVLSSWPRFDESKGKVTTKVYDPPGVAHFDPGRENEKRRQLRGHATSRNAQLDGWTPKVKEPSIADAPGAIQSLMGSNMPQPVQQSA
jgi:hypothetical protein